MFKLIVTTNIIPVVEVYPFLMRKTIDFIHRSSDILPFENNTEI